jgi:hypothetical protein
VHEKKAVLVKDDDGSSCNGTASAKALSFRREMHVTGGMHNAFASCSIITSKHYSFL